MKISYGFKQNLVGALDIIPQQATVIQEIYRQYLSGKSLGGVADFLFERKIPSPSGKDRWGRSVLDALLSNSKYIGTIVSFDDYYAVQAEKGRRSNIDESTNQRKATQYYSKDVLSGLFVCAECGAVYWRITKHDGEIIWRCSNKVRHGKRICQHAPSISEATLKQVLCQILGTDDADVAMVREALESISISEDGTFTPNFIEREFEMLPL